MPGGNAGYLVESEIDRIGPYAIRNFCQCGQIVFDLVGGDHCRGIERGLAAPEGRIGQAVKLLGLAGAWIRHRHRLAQPGPKPRDSQRRYGKTAESRSHWNPALTQTDRLIALRLPCQASAQAIGFNQGLLSRWTKSER